MNHHDLKIYEEHYNNVRAGTKTFEIRKNDRGFQKGDTVSLRLYNKLVDRIFEDESTPALHFRIGDVYVIDSETVVFSLLGWPNDSNNLQG